MNETQKEAWSFLMGQHRASCLEHGDHPDEILTAYSLGADAIERLAALDGK